MEKLFKLDFKTFFSSPNTYLFFITLIALGSVSMSLLAEKDKLVLQKDTENSRLRLENKMEVLNLKNCNLELQRRNKILEDIVFNQKLQNHDR